MKSAAVLSLALLVGSIALQAQNNGQQPSRMTVFRLPTINMGCPVSLRAQHGTSGNMLAVDKSRPKGIAQLLHLILTNPDSRRIAEASLTVHGLGGKGRVSETQSRQENSDAARTLEIRFPGGSDREVSGDLWVPGMTAVLSIDLNSVTYADGSRSSFTGREGCHVAPDPLMLIAGH
jgi:hypothetical protein